MKTLHAEIEFNKSSNLDLKKHLKELKYQQLLYKKLLNINIDGILVLDPSNKILFINQSAKILLNYDELIKQSDKTLEKSDFYEIFNATKKLDFLSYHREIEILNPSLKYYSISCIPYEFESNITSRIFFIKDITKQKLHTGEGNINPNFIDTLTFGSGLAHELGNPIAGLSLHAQILERLISKNDKTQKDKEQMKTSIDILNSELTRLDNTINDFLKAVRPTNPQFSLFNINDVILQVIDTLNEVAKEKSINIRFTQKKDSEPFLFDASRIKQALINVILNAIDVSKENSFIDINFNFKDELCKILIKDYGIGISPTEIMKIFDPYYTTKDSGNGLGLLITYRIIRDHNGTITVKSKPGKGTTFSINIPIRRKACKMLSQNT